jgi:hypothetical protein
MNENESFGLFCYAPLAGDIRIISFVFFLVIENS